MSIVFFSLGQFHRGHVAVGVAALKSTEARTERPFAMIPLLFGIQQMTEGVIWLTLSHDAPISKQLFVLLPACSSS